eukprot:TRINITY_DN1653_c0_g1_i2.p1 TRINITY_DN1653_c0_g1~~TRINITY_DN1653_c0_g1_i2.p1  ORF type:complete len:546 (-),score=158.34 TRINITY_DN1653_c0_g1_i2:442-2079(-)
MKLLQKNEFDKAVQHYTKGIELDSNNHILYSNRSAAYTKAQKYKEAVQDADKVIELNPSWPRGYSRKGTAQCFLQQFEEAKETFTVGLEKNPNDESLKEGLREVLASEKNSQQSGVNQLFGQLFQGDDMWAKLRLSPATKSYLDDPQFVQLLNQIQQNPGLVVNYLQDPRISAVMGVLLGVGKGGSEQEESGEEPKQSPPPQPKKEEPKQQPQKVEEISENKQNALKEKELGNAAYKTKDFETAISHYKKAIEHDQEDMTFHLNLAAVYLEQGKYDICITECQEAINKGRDNLADFKLISRAYHRIGNAYVKQEKYAEAITAYNKALTEHQNPETANALRRIEQLKKKKDELDYINPGIAEQEKELGNQDFKDGKIPEAIKHYSEAIKRNPKNHVYYSNRAACYTKLGEYRLAETDCDKSIEIDSTYVKAYSRKGTVQYLMKQYHKCLETYDKGLKLDPENVELTEGIQRTLAAINNQQSGARDEQAVKNAMQDPEIQQILSDPAMRQILSDMESDPKTASYYLKDPTVSVKINKLVAAGVIQVK